MSKKIVMLVICLSVVMLFVSGISGQAETTLNFIGMEQAALSTEEMDAIAREYEAINPDVKIITTYVNYDSLHDKQVTVLAAKSNALDLICMDCVWVPEFIEAGWVTDVSDKITADPELIEDTLEASWNMVRYKGKYWGMPWLIDAKYFFYNDDILNKAGISNPPKTWQEFSEQCQTIKDTGLVEYPTIWCWSQNECAICDFALILAGFDGKFVDEDMNPVFNDKNGVEALTWMVDTMKKNLSNPASVVSTEMEVLNTFNQGEAAFAINWLFMHDVANDPAESKVAGHAKMALMPAGAGKGVGSATVDGSMAYAVSAFSENKDAAWDYLQYFCGKEVQLRYSARQLPTRKSLLADPALIALQPVTVPMFKEQYPYVIARPVVPYYAEFSKILQVALQNALTGKNSPQEALDDAAEAIKGIQ
jgi:multiple sugar transport system substrate-binding protein